MFKSKMKLGSGPSKFAVKKARGRLNKLLLPIFRKLSAHRSPLAQKYLVAICPTGKLGCFHASLQQS